MYKGSFELALFNAAMALVMIFAGVAYAVFWPVARVANALHCQTHAHRSICFHG